MGGFGHVFVGVFTVVDLCSAFATRMATQPQSSARLTFGPFEVNASAGELRKGGVRVRLSSQPFQILLFLLSQPGDLVTREQLRQQSGALGRSSISSTA